MPSGATLVSRIRTNAMRVRTYTELMQLHTFEERYEYLRLAGEVGATTFGYDRWLNQGFYKSVEWKNVRNFVIARDVGMDLACEGYEIYDRIMVHHMNPMQVEDIENSVDEILNPEYLITTQHQTHNAIHYGDRRLLRQPFVERRRGDTQLW